MRNRAVVIGAGVLVAVLALAGILWASGLGKSTRTSTAPPVANTPSHGSLIYQTDLAKGGWTDNHAPSPDPAGGMTIGSSSTSVDLKLNQDGASVSGEFDGPGLKNYVANVVLRADTGSDMEFDWAVRSRASNETADVFLNLQVNQESMTLYLSPDGASNQALTPALTVPGLQGGTTMDLWIVVNGSNIQLWLGSKKVADINETAASGGTTPNFYLQGKSGTMHILAVRYYAVS